MCLSNLMLTGVATPYIFNGVMAVDYSEDTNFNFKDGKMGITTRNDIGLLFWDETPKKTEEAGLGSRLKTPILPIWVTCVNENWGVLFNPNKDLMKSYAAENRFNLYYYSNTTIKEKIDTILTIDTRDKKYVSKVNLDLYDDFDQIDENPLEKAIQTK